MDLVEDICREYNLTHETVQYINNVYQISQAFRNTPLRRLDHVSDLTNISMRMLRRIGRGLGIVNVNSIPSKELLENQIYHAYQCFINVPNNETHDNVNLPNNYMQQPLQLGTPIPYDSDEYFDLDVITELYEKYPVEYEIKKEETVLNIKTFQSFFVSAMIKLFKTHYRCFKHHRSVWYAYTPNNEWNRTDFETMNEFCLSLYSRLERISDRIHEDLYRAFSDTSIAKRNEITKEACVKLRSIIKNYS